MKLNKQSVRKESPVAGVCREAGRKALAQIAGVKAALVAEWSHALNTQQRAVRLALNEAEALACQTMYPHPVFPMLAAEKVQAVAAWETRQRQLWWNNLTGNRRNATDVL